MQRDCEHELEHARRMNTSNRLQRAGRQFLLRLVATHGLDEAASILRSLADELDELPLWADDEPRARLSETGD